MAPGALLAASSAPLTPQVPPILGGPAPQSLVRPFTSPALDPIACPPSLDDAEMDGGAAGVGRVSAGPDQNFGVALPASNLAELTSLMKMMGGEGDVSEAGDQKDLGRDPCGDRPSAGLHLESRGGRGSYGLHGSTHHSVLDMELDIVDGIDVYTGRSSGDNP